MRVSCSGIAQVPAVAYNLHFIEVTNITFLREKYLFTDDDDDDDEGSHFLIFRSNIAID